MSGPLAGLNLERLVWHSGSVIAMIVDGTGVLLDVNPTFRRLASRDPRGEPLVTFVSPAQTEEFSRWLLEAGSEWSTRRWGMLPDQTQMPRDIRLAACRSAHDRLAVVGEPITTEDLSSALLDVNETIIVEQRRLTREGERLDRVAQQDALTGVANRRAFDRRLAVEITRTAAGGAFSLVMLDVDHFKGLNDRYGHPTGDGVLRWLGELLQAATRPGDLVARYGGEEFVAILPDADATGATHWAERLRRAIASGAAPGVDVTVTASLGVATWEPGSDGGDVVSRADRSLYAAKRAGRNRTVTDGMDQPPADDATSDLPAPIWRASALGAAIVEGTTVRRANGALDRLVGRASNELPVDVLVHPDQARAFAEYISGASPEWAKATYGFDPDARGIPSDHVTWVRRRGGVVELLVEPAAAERSAVEETLLTLIDDMVEVQRELEWRTAALDRALADRTTAERRTAELERLLSPTR